jgi:hypothetical protein
MHFLPEFSPEHEFARPLARVREQLGDVGLNLGSKLTSECKVINIIYSYLYCVMEQSLGHAVE